MTASDSSRGVGGATRADGADRRFGRALLPLGVVAGWIAIEVALRRGLVGLVATDAETALAADWTILLVGFPLLAALLGWIAARRGVTPDEWGYALSSRAVAAGAVGIVVAVLVAAVAGQVDVALFSLERTDAAFGNAVTDVVRSAPALGVLFLIANGVVVPIAEETVWRGIARPSSSGRGAPSPGSSSLPPCSPASTSSSTSRSSA